MRSPREWAETVERPNSEMWALQHEETQENKKKNEIMWCSGKQGRKMLQGGEGVLLSLSLLVRVCVKRHLLDLSVPRAADGSR